jgi:hypothetical protein
MEILAGCSTDRVSPHNLEAERAVLGAILVDPATFEGASELIQPDDFFRDAHRWIFDAMTAVRARGATPDPITLADQLAFEGRLDEVGGRPFLFQLTDGVPKAARIKNYAAIVRDKSTCRRIIRRAADALSLAYEGDVDGSLESLSSAAGIAPTNGIAPRCLSLAEFFAEHAESTAVAPVIDGLFPGNGIVLVSGQPRDGKSLVVLECFLARATATPAFGLLPTPGEPQACWYISDEDPALEIGDRFAGMMAARGLLFDNPPETIRVSVHEGINLDDRTTQNWVISTVIQRKVRVLGIDPVRAHTGCADAGPDKFKPFGDFLRRLIRETRVVPVLVHHDVKPQADGKQDGRRRAQRASGGGIFSTCTAPISAERLDRDRALLVPDGFKYGADPRPIEVTFNWSHGLRLIGRHVESAQRAEAVSIEAAVLTYLRATPNAKTGDIPPAIKKSRPDVFKAIERLEDAGKVQYTAAGKAKH